MEKFEKLLQTNEVYRDVLGKWGAEITRNLINSILKAERKKYENEFKRLIEVFKKHRDEPMTGRVVVLELEVALDSLKGK